MAATLLFLKNLFICLYLVSLVSGFLPHTSRTRVFCKKLSALSASVNHHPTNTISSSDNKIDLLYDSDCPICAMEVEFLKKRDLSNRIRFTDLSSPDYNPADHGNVQFADGMRKIRAILPDNTVVTGVEVFRQTYKAIGLGWIFEITRLPIIGQAADTLYDIWAENRLRITGRGDLADLLRERAEKLAAAGPVDCEDSCDLDFDEDEEESVQDNI